MENKKDSEQGGFETLKTYPYFKVGKLTYFVSVQSITADNGKKSSHIVIKKIAMNDDGSPRGTSKQLFIPVDDCEKVLNNVLKLIQSK